MQGSVQHPLLRETQQGRVAHARADLARPFGLEAQDVGRHLGLLDRRLIAVADAKREQLRRCRLPADREEHFNCDSARRIIPSAPKWRVG